MAILPFGFDNARPGMVVMWDEPLSEIPVGWVLCDGNNGTVNILDEFLGGTNSENEVGNNVGTNTNSLSTSQLPAHTHPNSTTSSDGEHTHSFKGEDDESDRDNSQGAGSGGKVRTSTNGRHSHNIESVGSAGGNSSSIDNVPQYYEVALIQKV
jgi:microcystin-dependent protein